MHFKLRYWQFVQQKLQQEEAVVLLFVPQSIGSSPGKQGHQMAVAASGDLFGTIGGGAMEFKVVEQRKKEIHAPPQKIVRERLVHDRTDKGNWSGLSCSGEQTVLSVFLSPKDLPLIEQIVLASKNATHSLQITSNTITITPINEETDRLQWHYQSENEWEYQFIIGFRDTVYIIGGGHVGLALCRQLQLLEFKVILLDNRKELDTQEYDKFIDQKLIIRYKDIANFVSSNKHDYIVLMTFSSALDSLVLSQLILKPCRYIGMMASETKARRVEQEMLNKGFTTEDYQRVHTPIGLSISCKTPAEIAVSIAAQIIQIRNKSC